MDIDKEKLLKDIKKLSDLANKKINSRKAFDYFLEYNSFRLLFNEAFPNENPIEISINEEQVEKKYIEYRIKKAKLLRNFIIENHDELEIMGKTFSEMYENQEECFLCFFDKCRVYKEDEMKNIILEYFSTYSPNVYNIIKRYFDENRIGINITKDSEITEDYFLSSYHTSSGYVLVGSNNYSSFLASKLVHELGHVINFELFASPKHKTTLNNELLNEIISQTYEIGFIDYLGKKHIDIPGSEILLNNKLLNLYYDLSNLDFDLCALLSNDQSVDVDELFDNLDTEITYSLGTYFALHLSTLREELEPQEYQKLLDNLLSLNDVKKISTLISFMGLDENKFLNCDYLKPKLEKNATLVRKRFYE